MKIRQGFVSNSSTSSFILPYDTDKEKVLKFCKERLKKSFEHRIERLKETKFISNWEDNIRWLQEDIDNLDKTVKICAIKDYEWDLSEWFNLDDFCGIDLVLYDEDDNILNCITEEIVENFKVLDYKTHI